MAGHSKWAQIKHKKAVSDVKRGKIFSRIAREITVAAKTGGGPSPETNAALRNAVERARAAGIPKENIERAIARGAGGGSDAELAAFLFEATGPGGTMFLIGGITDSTNRTVAEVKHLLSLHEARLAEPGSVAWNFEKVGTIELAAADNNARSREDIELAVAGSGALDFAATDDGWTVETPFPELESVRRSLEESGIAVREAGHRYKPRSTVALDPGQMKKAEALLEALAEHDDVQDVYTNLGD